MKVLFALAAFGAALAAASMAYAAASTGSPFYGDAPDDHHPWAIHDQNRPQPKLVTPGTFSTQEQPGKPPSDAIVLFDGKDLSKWEADKPEGGATKWVVNKEGAMECTPGSGFIRTKEKLGDCQLHVEWAAPKDVKGDSQGRGNSGIFLDGVEVQVLDCYNNPTYADGFAGSVYSVNPPAANPLNPPGQFQIVDIIFRRPIYKGDKCLDPGYVTVFINGVLMQDHTQLEGSTGHMGRSKPGPLADKWALKFQDHGNPVRFRNVWYRELPLRAAEGGTDGPISTEATMAKRKEIAAMIRADAAKLKDPANPLPEMYRQLESLVYENDEATAKIALATATKFFAGVKALPADKLGSKKDEVKHLQSVLKYLTRFQALPATLPLKAEVDNLVKDQGWDKK
ncbi:MAG: DUF1080 domain-containing protein [Planctomycetota bacterium]|nr:DUF1080 domain-containing protein [Planctomycetota bacterium]